MGELFGGMFSKPGTAAKMALEAELRARARDWKPQPGHIYMGSADLILRHGTYWSGADFTDLYSHLSGEMGACFDNSLNAAEQAGLYYVEGVYSTGNTHFQPHAWVMDSQGRVTDVTWRREYEGHQDTQGRTIQDHRTWAYWGVPFHPTFVRAYFEKHHPDLRGMFDRPLSDWAATGYRDSAREDRPDWPILRLPYDRERTQA